MTHLDLQYAFELEANTIDAYVTTKLNSNDILHWLNTAVDKFIKTRFDGDNATRKSFEQNEKRSRDLIGLISSKLYHIGAISDSRKGFDIYNIVYPSDLMFVVDEAADVSCKDGENTKYWPAEIFECTLDNYMYRITNKLTDFHLRNNYARPIRVRTKDGCNLFTDGNYKVDGYTVTYIRIPEKISLDDPFKEYTDLPEFALREIVKIAVQMYFASINDPRYNVINNENNNME
jgi:hypothetical protein